jgi:hypothetical protein
MPVCMPVGMPVYMHHAILHKLTISTYTNTYIADHTSKTHQHAPTHPRTHAPTHPRTHAPTHPRTHAPTHPRTHVTFRPLQVALLIMRPALRWRTGTDDTTIMSPWLELSQHAQGMLPNMQHIWKSISPELYSMFWSLSLDDIFVPKDTYNIHIKRLKKAIEDLDDSSSKISVTCIQYIYIYIHIHIHTYTHTHTHTHIYTHT